jgi:hypothetical protein
MGELRMGSRHSLMALTKQGGVYILRSVRRPYGRISTHRRAYTLARPIRELFPQSAADVSVIETHLRGHTQLSLESNEVLQKAQ